MHRLRGWEGRAATWLVQKRQPCRLLLACASCGQVGGGWAQQVGGLKSIRWYVASPRCQPALLCHRWLSALRRNAEEPPLKPDPRRHWVELAAVGGACCSAVFLGWECKSGDAARGGERRGAAAAEVAAYRSPGYFRAATVRCRGQERLRNAEEDLLPHLQPTAARGTSPTTARANGRQHHRGPDAL